MGYDHWATGPEVFKGLNSIEIERIAATFNRHRFRRGHVIMTADEPSRHLWFISTGSIKVSDARPRRSEEDGIVIPAGHFFLDFSLFDGRPFHIRAVARAPVVCMRQSRQDCLRMLQRHACLKDYFCLEVMMIMERNILHLAGARRPRVLPNGFKELPPAITKSLDFIEKHYQEPLTLDRVACEIGMSRYHFSRVFNDEVGWSFKAYLNQKRVSAAKHIMTRKNKSVHETGICVGYTDQSYFSKVFKKMEGVTPSEYRRALWG